MSVCVIGFRSHSSILWSPVLELYGKLQDQMAAKQYYHALKILEQLEHTFLPRVRG